MFTNYFQDEDVELMTWNAQEEFLNLTVYSSRILKYPVNNNFSRLFFKKLLGQLQCSQEIHDGLYTSLCSLMDSEKADNFCYCHYVIECDFNNVITIKETNNIVVNGTTGLKTWDVGIYYQFYFCSYILLCFFTLRNNYS